nr:tetratricopeptide repeat protein [Azospirillum sp. SYSU D00513]
MASDPANREALAGLFALLDALGEAGQPEEAVARANFGDRLRRQGRLAEAEAHQRRALAWLPGFGGNHFQLAVTLQAQGRVAEAEAAYAEAGRLMPAYAPAPCNQGAMLRELGRLAEAEAALRRAVALDAALAPGWLNLGSVWRDQGRPADAARAFRNAAALRPDLAEMQANLGIALKEAGRVAESMAPLARALAIGLPDPGGVLAQLVQQQRHLCLWDGLPERSERLRRLVREGATRQVHPWIFLGEGAGPELELVCARRYTAWRTRNLAHAGPSAAPSATTRRGPGERLRLGYLSSDFQEHATAVLIAELIEVHDRSGFEVAGYSYGPDDGGPMRRRLMRAFDRFTDLSGLAHADAARRIREDGIDILIDLKGYTQGARVEIPALRPAPLQIQWLGYPGSMGADFIDYVIADPVVAPFSMQPAFAERILQLPDCYQPNDRNRPVGTPPSRAACGLPETGFVFCCFNAAYKITPAQLDLWIRLLMALPGSVLWLLEGQPEATANLRREAARRGVAPERLVFSPRLPLPDYLARYRLADLFLDTAPVGAHTTASDALWAGLPVLTVMGEGFASRVAASLLHAVGLPELAVASAAEYEAAALRLARNPAELAGHRARLAAAGRAAPLFDTDRFARSLERAYRAIWDRHAAGEPPRPFRVPALDATA